MKGPRSHLKRASGAGSRTCLRPAWVLICLLSIPLFSYGQVSPDEIKDPQLKALEKTYLKSLVEMKRAIGKMHFPFEFSLNRFAGLDPKEQVGADQRGLEFVNFHGRTVLKITGNYNASFSADLLTSNQRTNRIFDEIVSPILQIIPAYFSNQEEFNYFGFEISYHVRRHAQGYAYEGRENFVLVMEKSDALAYSGLKENALKQEALGRSETYLNGKEFVLALGQKESIDLETRDHTSVNPALVASAQGLIAPSKDSRGGDKPGEESGKDYRTLSLGERAGGGRSTPVPASAATPTQADVDALQNKFQSQIDAMAKEGLARHHFVEYAPPAFVVFQKKIFLQLTLRNPASFDLESTSIYRRAARSFDLFLAPRLKPILDKIPEDADFAGLDVTVLNDLVSKAAHSSEALEFVAPLKALRRFVNAEITNQELIDQSIVLVNGVRIALNLQQVE